MNLKHIFQDELDAIKEGQALTDMTWLHTLPSSTEAYWRGFPQAKVQICMHRSTAESEPTAHPFVSSKDVATVMKVSHFNALRALRSFAEHKGFAVDEHGVIKGTCRCAQPLSAVLSDHFVPGLSVRRRGSLIEVVFLWLPAFQGFVTWLLDSLKRHKGTHSRRVQQFSTFLGASGLCSEPPSLEMFLRQCFPDGRYVQPSNAAQAGEASVLDGDNLSTIILSAKTSSRVDMDALTRELGYSERQIRRSLATLRAEHAIDDADFGYVVDHSVSLKTAIYLAMTMPKAVSRRLMVFATLMQRLKPAPLEHTITFEGRTLDCGDPALIRQSFERQQLVLTQERQQHEHVVADLKQRQDSLESEARQAMAELSAARTEIGSLKASMTTMTTQGSIMAAPHSDSHIHSADALRRDHGMRGTRDVIKAVFTSGVLTPDVMARVMEPPARNLEDGVRLVLRFYASHKFLNADGQPDLRPQVVLDGEARAFRVYVPNRAAVGAQAKHGTYQDWRWMVFFTPKGEENVVARFPELLKNWCDAGRPKHAVSRNPHNESES